MRKATTTDGRRLAAEVPLAAVLDGRPLARAVFEAIEAVLVRRGPVEVHVTRSEIAFRRRRGFAFLWLPGRYLARPPADVVLSIALDRRDPSPRFKEVVHPSDGVWLHHLEVRSAAEVDAEVAGWLAEAAESRG